MFLLPLFIDSSGFFVPIFSVSCLIEAFCRTGGACNAVHYIQQYMYFVKLFVTFDETSSVPHLKVRFKLLRAEEEAQ